jgi:type II secretory pathway pseudopilin PulG
MKCYSEKFDLRTGQYHARRQAFSLIESAAALVILALICSSVLVVINRCIASAADSALRMNAFEVARENMERILVSDAVAEMTEYGSSEKYPNIQWQTTVEAFYESATSRMWLKGTCSAEYTDTVGEPQKIELNHWLTDLTREQLLEIMGEKSKQDANNLSPQQIIETEDKAAEYAGVDVQVIKQWVDAGMQRTPQGYYIKTELDLYKRTGGSPTIEDRRQLEETLKKQSETPKETPGKSQQQGEQNQPNQQTQENTPTQRGRDREQDEYTTKKYCGYTMQELEQMSFDQMWQILMNCNEI